MTDSVEIDRETKQLLMALELKTGQSSQAVLKEALRAEFKRCSTNQGSRLSNDEIRRKVKEIHDRVAKLPVLDNRSDEEIIGYDEYGLP